MHDYEPLTLIIRHFAQNIVTYVRHRAKFNSFLCGNMQKISNAYNSTCGKLLSHMRQCAKIHYFAHVVL